MTTFAPGLSGEAVELVRDWLKTADKIGIPSSAKLLARLLTDQDGLDFAVAFVDEVVRPEDVRTSAANLAALGAQPPKFLPAYLRFALKLGARFAPLMPPVVVPAAKFVLRQAVSHLIVDATPRRLTKSIKRLRAAKLDLNINLLGEAVMGEREANRRLARSMDLLRRDDVSYVSIKVSATVPPQQRWGFQETVDLIVDRLEPMFRLAATAAEPKFINLDMEEYKDLELTIGVFQRLLSKQEFKSLRAGIVLQTYLPDAMSAMMRLQEWAAERVSQGGAPIKVRLVKGANLPMELVDAELHDWPPATLPSKQATDTNYLRVLDYSLDPDRIQNISLGIAGHNLFDIAFAWCLASARGVQSDVEFEMLLGMAPGQAEAVRRTVGGLLVYVPVVHPREFDVAIAYLIRRLEEGASSENFMSAVFELSRNQELFEREEHRFLASLAEVDEAVPSAHRTQSRLNPPEPRRIDHFESTPDSDPAVMANQTWATSVRAAMRETTLGSQTRAKGVLKRDKQLNQVFELAANSSWRDLSAADRAAVLHAAGDELELRRGDLCVIAGNECNKTIDQSDPEVSEACDFAHYYAARATELAQVDGAAPVPPKIIVVTPPWNFPIAIPAGSVLSALATGASVILKPAPQAERCAAVVVECLHAAGVPADALQYVVLPEETLGSALVSDPRVSKVILTGAYETAGLFKRLRPELTLLAETSGKNAIIVTPSADLDLAVRDIVASAFGHAGQKCSAASLVIMVGAVAKSSRFRTQLVDAIRSIHVGEPENALTQVGPLTNPAEGKLLAGLTKLEPGQRWIIEPRQLDSTGKLWRPGLRAGVTKGSQFHQVEYFGPVLGLMTANSLEEAIGLANDVRFGLTSGLHSLDPAEIRTWLANIHCGNLYVNRGTTGAIVRRQPFGGWKRSVVGPTTKAGGPNYLLALSEWVSAPASQTQQPTDPQVLHLLKVAEELVSPADHAGLIEAAGSDEAAWEAEFSLSRDATGLKSEVNVLRYLPVGEQVTVRLSQDGSLRDLVRVLLAAQRSGCAPVVSSQTRLPGPLQQAVDQLGWRSERCSDSEFAAQAAEILPAGRLRMIGSLAGYPARADLAVYDHVVTQAGRLEMLPFLAEQAVSITANRFGSPRPVPLTIDAEPYRQEPSQPAT